MGIAFLLRRLFVLRCLSTSLASTRRATSSCAGGGEWEGVNHGKPVSAGPTLFGMRRPQGKSFCRCGAEVENYDLRKTARTNEIEGAQ